MASAAVSARTQTPKTAPQFQLAALRSHIYTMAAAFVGVIFGVLGSMGFVGGYLHSQFAAENAALSSKVVSMAPTSETTAACAVPASTASAPKVKTAAAVAPSANVVAPVSPVVGGKGGDTGGNTPSGPTTFVSQMVSGSISDTGYGSKNSITGTNSYQSTVTNNNSVNVSNDNDQSAHSGSAKSSENTQGGSATTGDSSNVNSTSTSISIKN